MTPEGGVVVRSFLSSCAFLETGCVILLCGNFVLCDSPMLMPLSCRSWVHVGLDVCYGYACWTVPGRLPCACDLMCRQSCRESCKE